MITHPKVKNTRLRAEVRNRNITYRPTQQQYRETLIQITRITPYLRLRTPTSATIKLTGIRSQSYCKLLHKAEASPILRSPIGRKRRTPMKSRPLHTLLPRTIPERYTALSPKLTLSTSPLVVRSRRSFTQVGTRDVEDQNKLSTSTLSIRSPEHGTRVTYLPIGSTRP